MWPISLLNTDNKLLSSILASTSTSFTPINKSRPNRLYSSETAWGLYETNTEYHRYSTETEITCVNYDWRCSEGFQEGAMALLIWNIMQFLSGQTFKWLWAMYKEPNARITVNRILWNIFCCPHWYLHYVLNHWQTTLGKRRKLKVLIEQEKIILCQCKQMIK